ncbi:transglycosylase family protein [Streptomyces sirii]|uniref:transglycosylase family protein n=1 Tax=Streptomyces sirii TaxID=3127701 RepID=UPI003D367873
MELDWSMHVEAPQLRESKELPEMHTSLAEEGQKIADRVTWSKVLSARAARGVTTVAVVLAMGSLNMVSESAEAVSSATWDRLALCESGGDWGAEAGNGLSGGLQFVRQTWHSFGGDVYAQRASLASREQQIQVAARVLGRQGWGAWPACAASLGLRGIPRAGARTQPDPTATPLNRHRVLHAWPDEIQRKSASSGLAVVNSGDSLTGIAYVCNKPWQEFFRENRQAAAGGNSSASYPGALLRTNVTATGVR